MPFVSPDEALLAEAPDAAVEAVQGAPGALDTAASAWRQWSSVTSLYERVVNERTLPAPSWMGGARATTLDLSPVEGYDPFGDIAGFEEHAMRFVRAESPNEVQLIKDRIRQETHDKAVIDRAGGWGVVASLAAGVTDPLLVASMAVPAAPAVGALGRAGRVATGVAAQAAIDTTAEAMLHSQQELRTVGESALNIGAGAILSGVLGAIATRVPKAELEATRKALHAQIYEAVRPAEGMDAAGASRVVETTLEDEGIAKGGRWLARSLGKISPETRLLTSPLKAARILTQKLVDVPYLLQKNLKGIATHKSVEGMVKRLVNTGRRMSMKMLDTAFVEYKQAGGTLGRRQFSEEVSAALTRGDASSIPQVASVVSWARKVFDEDKAFLKSVGIEMGDEVLGAKSYFPRVYNFEKIIANRHAFEEMLYQWYKNNPKMQMVKNAEGVEEAVPRVLEDAEIRAEVLKTVDRILGMPTAKADLNLRSRPAMLKERVLDAPDELLAPYLERDFDTVMSGYFRGIAPEIEMRRAGFSSPELNTEIDEITEEAHRLIAATTDDVKKEAIRKAQEKAIQDIALLRDRLLGNVGTRGSKHVALVRAARIARTYNYVRLLGSQMLSSMSDAGKLVARYGLVRTADRTARFLTNWNLNKLTREEAKRIGTALEFTFDMRASTLGDIAEELPRTRLDKGMQWASSQFSKLSLMSPWNATLKGLATLLEQDEMARALSRMNKHDVTRLAASGIDQADVPALRAMFAKHSEEVGGVVRARTELWEDQRLARIVEDSIAKVADEIVVTKGIGDLPAFMDNEFLKTVLQFRSFAMASVNRTMIPVAQGLAMGDARTAQGVASMLALGMMTYYTKEFAAGREPDTSPERLIAEAFNWSGMLGYIPDLWDPIASFSPENEEGENILPRFSRFKSRSPTESLFGPTFGTGLDTLGGTLKGFLDMELEQRDVERFRRLMPAQNLFYTRRLFNAIEGETGEALGAEGSTTQTFGQRLTEEVPTK